MICHKNTFSFACWRFTCFFNSLKRTIFLKSIIRKCMKFSILMSMFIFFRSCELFSLFLRSFTTFNSELCLKITIISKLWRMSKKSIRSGNWEREMKWEFILNDLFEWIKIQMCWYVQTFRFSKAGHKYLHWFINYFLLFKSNIF